MSNHSKFDPADRNSEEIHTPPQPNLAESLAAVCSDSSSLDNTEQRILREFGHLAFSEDELMNCIKNDKLDVIRVGSLIILARIRKLDIESVLKEFIKRSFSLVKDLLSTNDLYKDENRSPLMYGMMTLNRIQMKKLDSNERITNIKNPPKTIDAEEIVTDIGNIRTKLVIPDNIANHFIRGKVIDMVDLVQPSAKLSMQRKISFLMFELLRQVTYTAASIQKYTFRTRKIETYPEDSDENRLQLLPKELTEIIFQIMVEYCGLDKPCFAPGYVPIKTLELDEDFIALGDTLENRLSELKKKKEQFVSLTEYILPDKMKSSMEEVRRCIIEPNEEGELVLRKRRHKKRMNESTMNESALNETGKLKMVKIEEEWE